MTTQDAAPVADQPDNLAVAQALEQAAKVCDDVDNEYEEGRAYVAAERIRALIPADLAAEAHRQVERIIPFRIQVHGTLFEVGCKLSTVMGHIKRVFKDFEKDAARAAK